MRSQFLLFPAALIASAPALAAESHQYLTLAQARAVLFPGAKFTPRDLFLTEAQHTALKEASKVVVWSYSIKAWKASTGGWLFLDQVPGRDDNINYAVAINPDGSIKGIEILQCLPRYDAVRNPSWLAQFASKRHTQADLTADIAIISGTSLSSIHIADGVRRVLATHALFFAPQGD